MIDMSKKKCLVYDVGNIFVEEAVRLARDCAEVRYYGEWRDAFPEMTRAKSGTGFDGIEHVMDFESHKKWADFIFVPDTLCAPMVKDLREEGYAVAAAGSAEKLELKRWETRQLQSKMGLARQETVPVKGMTALVKFLKENDGWMIKVDTFRGLLESFKHVNWRQSEGKIDVLRCQAGPFKESVVFVCEKLLEGIEPGLDGITFDGELLFPTQAGYEAKKTGIIERVYNTEKELPAPMREINAGFSEEFKKHKMKFFFSLEFIMGKDKIPYVIDPTIRKAALGADSIQQEQIKNYAAVVYGMAVGEKIAPIMNWKYGAAILGNKTEPESTWTNVQFPRDMKQWVKFSMAAKVGGNYYAAPKTTEICTVLGFGNTVDEAYQQARDRSKEVSASGLKFNYEAMEELIEDSETGKSYGVQF